MLEVNSKTTSIFILNFEHKSHLFLIVSIVEFEQVNVCSVKSYDIKAYKTYKTLVGL